MARVSERIRTEIEPKGRRVKDVPALCSALFTPEAPVARPESRLSARGRTDGLVTDPATIEVDVDDSVVLPPANKKTCAEYRWMILPDWDAIPTTTSGESTSFETDSNVSRWSLFQEPAAVDVSDIALQPLIHMAARRGQTMSRVSERIKAELEPIGRQVKDVPELCGALFPKKPKQPKMTRAQRQAAAHPACVNGCYVHSTPIGDITPNQLKALRCPTCAEPLANAKGRAKRTNLTRRKTTVERILEAPADVPPPGMRRQRSLVERTSREALTARAQATSTTPTPDEESVPTAREQVAESGTPVTAHPVTTISPQMRAASPISTHALPPSPSASSDPMRVEIGSPSKAFFLASPSRLAGGTPFFGSPDPSFAPLSPGFLQLVDVDDEGGNEVQTIPPMELILSAHAEQDATTASEAASESSGKSMSHARTSSSSSASPSSSSRPPLGPRTKSRMAPVAIPQAVRQMSGTGRSSTASFSSSGTSSVPGTIRGGASLASPNMRPAVRRIGSNSNRRSGDASHLASLTPPSPTQKMKRVLATGRPQWASTMTKDNE